MKKAVCFILSIILLISSLTLSVSAAGIGFLTKPTVFISGEQQYNIVWVTDEVSAAFVEITSGGVTYVFRDEKDGIVRTDDFIHTVRVPKSVLDTAKSYTAISRTVLSNDASGIVYENEMRYDNSFTPYSGQQEIKFGFFSDLHLRPAELTRLDHAKNILDSYIGGADVIVLNGDITDAMPSENYFTETLLEAGNRLSGGTLPVVYVRGNHEARGEWAQYLKKYLAFDTGEMYGTFSYGPISSVVADCGEDKADGRGEYGGMVDFNYYLTKQLAWLENIAQYTSGGSYYLGISHSPAVLDRLKNAATSAMLALGTDIVVGGHYHTAQQYDFASYATVTDGGLTTNGYRAGGMVFKDGVMTFNVYNEAGENLFSHQVTAQPKTTLTRNSGSGDGDIISTQNTEFRTHSEGGTGDTATITVDPVVFDCGDNYNVVFMTDAGSDMTKATVEVTKDGVTTVYTDSRSGNAVSDLLHSVEIPKYALEGASYKVKVTHIGSYGAYGEHISYDGIWTDTGCTVTSGQYSFPDFAGKDDLCIAAFSDMSGISDAVKVKSSLTVKPELVILGGNMADGLYSKNDFAQSILQFACTLTGGEAPVILCRGAGESYGDFAPYLSDYIQVKQSGVANGMYFTTSYGDINIVVCDTAGAAASPEYFAKQQAWLSTATVESGGCTLVAAADSTQAAALLGDSYAALGCIDILGQSGEYGTVSVYDSDSYGKSTNGFAGTGDIATQPITAAAAEGRYGKKAPLLASIQTNANAVGFDNTIPEDDKGVTSKETDLAWYTLMMYKWIDRGFDTDLPEGEITAMNCSRFLTAYANLCGVDFDKLSGTNTSSKAIAWAFDCGIISYSPPMLHEFTAEEINNIMEK